MHDDAYFDEAPKPIAALVEFKAGRCDLSGPWTNPAKGNMQRALRAFGLLPEQGIPAAARVLYEVGRVDAEEFDICLIAVGSETNSSLETKMPRVLQITWDDAKRFIFRRFSEFGQVKRYHDQWDDDGKNLIGCFYGSGGDIDAFLSSVVVT